MGLSLLNLDDITRRFMLEEIEIDAASGNLYLSSRLSSQGQVAYKALLKKPQKLTMILGWQARFALAVCSIRQSKGANRKAGIQR